jgi:hypothetical protein
LIGKLEGKRQLGRSRHIWEDNIKMDLRGMGWEGGLEDRWRELVNTDIDM